MTTKQVSGVREFFWRGRTWKILRLKDDEAALAIGTDNIAKLISDEAKVLIRASASKELQRTAIFHEFGHEMFPEWKTEPAESSASELGVFERDMPALLVALDVDLSPLVDW